MAVESSLAGVVRVAYEAQTGTFTRDTEAAATAYIAGNEAMSNSSIRLGLAQDKLRTAVAKGPAASRAQAAALLEVRTAERALAAETARATVVTERQNRGLGGLRSSTTGAAAGVGGLRTSVLGLTPAILGGAGLIFALRRAYDSASDLNEQVNKSRAVFAGASPAVEAWSRTTADGLGIAQDKALEAAGTFGNLLHTVGLVPTRAAAMSRSLVKLSADLASFNNTSPEDALEAIRSGLIGEAEPLRRYGVLLSEARVAQEAMRATGKRTAAALTDQEKALARYRLILRDTVPAQGDFARTADQGANAARRLRANVRQLGENMGTAFIPAVREGTKWLNDFVGGLNRAGAAITDFTSPISGGGGTIRTITEFRNLPVDLQNALLEQGLQPATLEGGSIPNRPEEGSRGRAASRPAARTPGGGSRPTARTLLDVQVDLARTQATGDTAGQVRLLREERDRFQRQIRFLENRKTLTDAQKTKLQALYGQLSAAQGELDGIAEAKEQAITDQREAAAARREKILAARKAKEEAAAKRLEAQTERINQLAERNTARINKALAKAQTGKQQIAEGAGGKTAGRAPTPEETDFAQEILKGVGAIFDNYYGNVVGHQQITTATLEHLTREQTAVMKDAFGRPHVGYTRLIDEAAMMG